MPKRRRKLSDSKALVDELLRRSKLILGTWGSEIVSRGEDVLHVWDNGDVRIAYSTKHEVYKVSFKQGQVPEGLVYAGPNGGEFNSYIHLAGVVKTLEILRRLMVLDDLADV